MVLKQKRTAAKHKTGPETVSIFANGDLYLETETQRLLVSSVVLSVASPVFSAMLNSSFKEGSGNPDNAGLAIRTVPIPEDHPEAIKVVCQILHHCTEDISEAIWTDFFLKIAIVCHKYDCVKPLKPWITVWMPAIRICDDEEELNQSLYAAYILDLSDTFSEMSFEMIKANRDARFTNLSGFEDPGTVTSLRLGMSFQSPRSCYQIS